MGQGRLKEHYLVLMDAMYVMEQDGIILKDKAFSIL